MTKQPKHIDMKPPIKMMSTDLQDNQFARNKPYGFPRTEQSHVNYLHNNNYQPNPQKLQLDYHHLVQEVDHLKHQFFNDHL